MILQMGLEPTTFCSEDRCSAIEPLKLLRVFKFSKTHVNPKNTDAYARYPSCMVCNRLSMILTFLLSTQHTLIQIIINHKIDYGLLVKWQLSVVPFHNMFARIIVSTMHFLSLKISLLSIPSSLIAQAFVTAHAETSCEMLTKKCARRFLFQ